MYSNGIAYNVKTGMNCTSTGGLVDSRRLSFKKYLPKDIVVMTLCYLSLSVVRGAQRSCGP